MKRILALLILVLFVFSAFTILNVNWLVPPVLAGLPPVHNLNTTESFSTIQAAINDPDTLNGHTITVDPSTFTENVVVSKSLNLYGSGPSVTVVNASDPNSHVFDIQADYVNLIGFKINNATGLNYAGIYASNRKFLNISGNQLECNSYGIFLLLSSNNSISGNTITNSSRDGIRLYSSVNNTVSGNKVTNSSQYGISLSSSSNNNSVTGNTFTNSSWDGILLDSSSNNSVSGNAINRNWAGIRLLSSVNNTVSGNTVINSSSFGIVLGSSGNNTVSGNTITNSSQYGIYLDYSGNNTVSGNTVTNNSEHGILLYSSSNNSVSGNTVTNNSYCGIHLESSSNNTISDNNVTGNCNDGIWLDSSSNYNTVSGNTVTNNSYCGIILYSSSNYNTVSGNTVTNSSSGVGIYLDSSSNYNTVSGNTVTDTSGNGIHLSSSFNNSVSGNTVTNSSSYGIELYSSGNNTVSGNNVTDNSVYGIYLYSSWGNWIFNNYFSNSFNAWDNGQNYWNTSKGPDVNIVGGPYPGGNYWSDYAGVDNNNDSLGDTNLPYNCGGNIVNGGDWLPLTPPAFQHIGDLNIGGTPRPVVAVSNSTITGFSCNNTVFCFNVTGIDGTLGYCALIVPMGLNLSDYVVYINGTAWPYTLSSNGTHYYIHVNYTHSQSEITVQSPGGFVPEFPFCWLPILAVAVALIFWASKGRRKNYPFLNKI